MHFLRIAFIHGIWLLDLTFTRLLDSVKYESGTFIADFVSSFVIKGPLDGIYLWNKLKQDCSWELCVNTLKASCEEFVFVDQALCKWILLASNSGTFAQNSLGNIRDYFIGILFELYAIKSFSECFFFCFRDSQFFP